LTSGARSRASAVPSFSGPLHQPRAGIPTGTDEMFDVRHLLSHGASWRSIALQGILVPVVVRDDGDGFELVAGFHRIAAARSRARTALQLHRAAASARGRHHSRHG